MRINRIVVASDHAGYELKKEVLRYFEQIDYEINGNCFSDDDYGPYSSGSVDYPYYASKVANKVSDRSDTVGILICGTGQGMAMAANKYYKVRAAICHTVTAAILSREHNNANILCLGASCIQDDVSLILEAWLTTLFSSEERHRRRVDLIDMLD